VVVDQQQAVVRVGRIPVAAEAERVLGVEPADVGLEPVVSPADVNGGRQRRRSHTTFNYFSAGRIPGRSHRGGGAGIRPSPVSTGPKRPSPASQADRASTISSFVRATKFHHMRTGSGNGVPPMSRARAGPPPATSSPSSPPPGAR